MASTDQRPPAIFLMGPTASGKTTLALQLADRFPLELISVDSALVYRGMDVGTAKPDAATLARHPHRLIDIRDPEQAYSAAEFRRDALAAMAEIASGGRIPLLVGGTGLYFRALERGLSKLPEADPAVRARLESEAETEGLASMHARLTQVDPAAARRIHPKDPQRIQRALEVIALTGKPLSAQQHRGREPLPYRVLKLALLPAERATLHARIAARFEAMLADGLIEEVRSLRRRPALSESHPSMRAVGYRQTWQFLDSAFDREGLQARGIHATRQLAKRQITWLRAEYDALALDPDATGLETEARRRVNAFLA